MDRLFCGKGEGRPGQAACLQWRTWTSWEVRGSVGRGSQWWGGQLKAWPPSALAVSTLRPQAVPVNRMDGRGPGRPLTGLQAGAVHEDSSRPHHSGPAPLSSQPSSGPPDPHSGALASERTEEGEPTRPSPDSPQGPQPD